MQKIYLDSDFVISFLKPEKSYLYLFQGVCEGHAFIMPQEVYTELSRKSDIVLNRVNTLIKCKSCEIFTIDTSHVAATYRYLLQQRRPKCKQIGSGEAAAIALCVTEKGVLASNNMSDVSSYTFTQGIKHITTARVLVQAYEIGLISSEEAEQVWRDMINCSIRLPQRNFNDYYKSKEYWPL